MAEIEAKFLLRRPDQLDDVLALLDSRGYEVEPAGTSTHVDRYFDTEDWAIFRAGWAYRCRSRGKKAKLTLKSLDAGDQNVFVREEIEQRLPKSKSARKGKLPKGPVQALLKDIAGSARRKQLFRVESRRSVYHVATPEDTPARVELDFDQTIIKARKRSKKAPGRMEFTELELELESGDADAVASLSSLLREKLELTPAQYSKFERGIQSAGIKIPQSAAPPVGDELGKDDSVISLLFAYLDHQLRKLKRQQPRAWEGIDPEGVHQMRVAIRRMRAVFRAFRGVLGEDVVVWVNGELRWLAKQLGRARDADVIEADARNARQGEPSDYEIYLQEQTEEAYTRLVAVMESERYVKLVSWLERFVHAGPDKRVQEEYGDLSIAECSKLLVMRAFTKMRAHGDAIQPNTPARQLHKLRIEAKRFRYLVDFFSTVQHHKWQEAIEATEELQEILGQHQDAITAIERLAIYAGSLSPADESTDELLNTARLMQKEFGRVRDCRRDFESVWEEFRKSVS